jgi:HAD superfamily hydrolase (TIGR01509 family)
MLEPELVIFDCDGVLVDSEVISNGVLARMLTAEGLPTTLAQARRAYQGLLLGDVLSGAQRQLGRTLPEDWLARYEHERAAAFREELRAVAGAADAVRLIKHAGIAVCVASQGKLSKTDLSLRLTGLAPLFPPPTRFSAHEVARGKPAPDLFLLASQTMGADPARCVVVEDTPSGVTAAMSAGMRALGYAADSDEQALLDAGAAIVRSLEDLPGLLGLARAR